MHDKSFRSDIEGLRAIAILAVVGYHASPTWIPGGFIGVDIFFVISGFLISKNIFTSLTTNSFSLTDFYSRRIRRIFPALLIVLIFSAIVGWFYFLSIEYRDLSKHIAGAILFVENILYYFEHGYFDDISLNKPLLQLWSLGVEEQFYLFWPILIWICFRFKYNLNIIILFIIFISFLYNISGGVSSSISSFFLVQSRMWELALGSLLALPCLNQLNLKYKFTLFWFNISPFIGIVLIFFSIFSFSKNIWFPGWWALIPCIGTFLIISGNPNSHPSKFLLSNKIFIWFGKISFPLYLWHWVLLSFFYIIFPEFFNRFSRIALILISIFLSWITYKYIETFFRKNSNLFIKVSFLVTSMFLLLIFSFISFYNSGFPSRYFAKQYIEIEKAITDWDFPKGLIVNNINGIKYLSTSDLPPSVLFIGDSHTDQFAPRILFLTKNNNFPPSAFITYNGCPPIPYVFEDKHPNCSSFLDRVNTALDLLPTITTIIIGGCWNCYFITERESIPDINNFNYFYHKDNIQSPFRNGDGSILALKSLELYLFDLSKKYRVILLLDNQLSPLNDPRHLLKNRFTLYSNISTNSFFELDMKQKNLNSLMSAMAKRLNIEYIDPLFHLCPNDRCPIFNNSGSPIFKDNHHLRSSFVYDHALFIDDIIKK